MRVKMSKQPPPAPATSAVGPCPTVIQIVGRPGTGSLPSTIAPCGRPHRYKVVIITNLGQRQRPAENATDLPEGLHVLSLCCTS